MQSSTFEFETATSLVNFVGQKKLKYYFVVIIFFLLRHFSGVVNMRMS